MIFFTAFNPVSQDILEKVGQEAELEDVEKGAKGECLKFRDRFKFTPKVLRGHQICSNSITVLLDPF
jgi:hypothetical protein